MQLVCSTDPYTFKYVKYCQLFSRCSAIFPICTAFFISYRLFFYTLKLTFMVFVFPLLSIQHPSCSLSMRMGARRINDCDLVCTGFVSFLSTVNYTNRPIRFLKKNYSVSFSTKNCHNWCKSWKVKRTRGNILSILFPHEMWVQSSHG